MRSVNNLVPVVLAIAGGTCSGKTVLANRLRSIGFVSPISTTSRPPRPEDRDGFDYRFVDANTFRGLVENCEMLEHSFHSGYHYGISREEMRRAIASGAPVVAVVDPSGVRALQAFAEAEGHVFCSAFLNVPARLQRVRLFDRFARAVLAGKDADILSEDYSERLLAIEGEETQWATDAVSGCGPYSVIFPCFDEKNEAGVISSIIERCFLNG